MPIIMESRPPGAPKWYLHPVPVPEGATSSFSSQGPQIRELYLFGYRDFPGVWVSRGGFDIDHETLLGQLMGIGTRRIIGNLSDKEEDQGLDLVGDLREGPCRLFVWLKGRQLEYRISLDDTPEDVSMRRTVETLVNEKEQVILNMYLEMCAFAGKGKEAAKVFIEAVAGSEDHDVRHYWLVEKCPCQSPQQPT